MHRITFTLTAAFALTLGIGLWATGCGGGGATDHADHDHSGNDHAGHDHAAHAAEAGAPEKAEAKSSMGHATVDAAGAVRSFDARPPVGSKALCPVSGEAHIVNADTVVVEHEGRHYAFCCGSCQPKFEAAPASFADAGAGG